MSKEQQTDSNKKDRTREEKRPVQLATEGVGPLYQRDYILTLKGGNCTPAQVMDKIRAEFPRFSPDLLASFTRSVGADRPLRVGDTMHVRITGGGGGGVLVVQSDEQSLTLRTQAGHMEAGRVTFGAYLDEEGRLICRIRSRSRIRDFLRYLSYRLFGMNAQEMIWTEFLERVGKACGAEQVGDVQVITKEVSENAADKGRRDTPTFCPSPDDEAQEGAPGKEHQAA